MFGKYNINDLFIASINVTYPVTDWEITAGGMLMEASSYGYLTIVRKNGDKFIDLQDPSIKLIKPGDSKIIGYKIEYMEPLNKYYTQNGKKKATFNRRKAIKVAKEHYNDVHQNHMDLLEEKNKSL